MKLNKLVAKVLTLAVTISVLVLPVAAFAEEAPAMVIAFSAQ